jgi:hypothetical protein
MQIAGQMKNMSPAERFRILLDKIQPCYAEKISSLIKRKGLEIITDAERINEAGNIRWAATIDGRLYYRDDRIFPHLKDYVMLHEMLHMFVEERDGLTPNDFSADFQGKRHRRHPRLSLYDKVECEVEIWTEQEAERLDIRRPNGTEAAIVREMRSFLGTRLPPFE